MRLFRLTLFAAALLFSSSLFAAGINFMENTPWKAVLSLAKKQNKLIFLDAYAVWCGPCKYLQKNVFTEKEVGAYYNKNFINVAIDMEKGEGIELSEKYQVTSYPTLFFIDGDGNVVHQSVGAMEAGDFISLGKDALNPETQYFTIKKHAATGKTKPGHLHAWIHAAEGMEDPDADEVLNRYLAATVHPILEEQMISLIMDHAKVLSKAQLDHLYKNRVQAARLIEAKAEAFDEALLKLVIHHSREQAITNKVLNFAAFHKHIEAYYPSRALLETQKMKVAWYVEQEEASKALTELSDLIKNPAYAVPVSDMAMAVVDATNLIVGANRGEEFVRKVQAYEVMAAEKKQTYFKDLALMMLHFRMDEKDKMKIYIDRILGNDEVPEAITEMVKSFLAEEE